MAKITRTNPKTISKPFASYSHVVTAEGAKKLVFCAGQVAAGVDIKLAIATQGKRVNLPGGLPVIVDGHVVGAIGVGSGTGEQDREVAAAALGAIAGAKRYTF